MKILFVLGTRPEAIKLCPLIIQANQDPKFQIVVVSTGQHREMLHGVFEAFEVKPHYNLDIMTKNQQLFSIFTTLSEKLNWIFNIEQPDLVLVQGDTTSAFTGTFMAYLKKIKIGHVEAGLRSFDKYAPWPEEGLRKMISTVTDFHFAPTLEALTNLLNEGHKDKVFQVGNTVIDALYMFKNQPQTSIEFYHNYKKTVLITGHRRENFGIPFIEIFSALKRLAIDNPNVSWIYPIHLNPNVKKVADSYFENLNNFYLLKPQSYKKFISLMLASDFIITDSGGIQEEAPALNKPLIVTREVTERPEVVNSNAALLVGHNYDKIVDSAQKLLDDPEFYQSMQGHTDLFGDGTASKKILDIIKDKFKI